MGVIHLSKWKGIGLSGFVPVFPTREEEQAGCSSFERSELFGSKSKVKSHLTDGSFRPSLRDPAGQLRCLSNPTRHELLVELVVLVDVEVARVLVLGLAGGEWTQRRAAE